MAKVTVEISTVGFIRLMGIAARLGLPAKEILGVAVEMAVLSLENTDVMIRCQKSMPAQ